jgi:uncharacterized protein YcfJ
MITPFSLCPLPPRPLPLHCSPSRRGHTARAVALLGAGWLLLSPASAQLTVYEHANFEGRQFTTTGAVTDLRHRGLNDRASAAVVAGSRSWELCDDAGFSGRCRVLRPGQYPSLDAMGLNDRVSSARALPRNTSVETDRYAPEPRVKNDYRRRPGERLVQAPVTAVVAVYPEPDRNCRWDGDRQTSDERGTNVPGALLGAVIGGILGHQIGGGAGRDLATAGGAIAGAVVGSRSGSRGEAEPLRSCEDLGRAAAPIYWDVTYSHRSTLHRVQMTRPPGATITVNRQGEPRV